MLVHIALSFESGYAAEVINYAKKFYEIGTCHQCLNGTVVASGKLRQGLNLTT